MESHCSNFVDLLSDCNVCVLLINPQRLSSCQQHPALGNRQTRHHILGHRWDKDRFRSGTPSLAVRCARCILNNPLRSLRVAPGVLDWDGFAIPHHAFNSELLPAVKFNFPQNTLPFRIAKSAFKMRDNIFLARTPRTITFEPAPFAEIRAHLRI